MPLEMFFFVLLQLKRDYKKSYSSCAWHLRGENDKCLIVYFGGRDFVMTYAVHPDYEIMWHISIDFVCISMEMYLAL